MNIVTVIPETQNEFKRHLILYEESLKKQGEMYLAKKEIAYLKREHKLHLYFQMPQSVIGYGAEEMHGPWFNDIRDVCWHCPPVSQDHLVYFAYTVTEEYTTTKLAFGYKLIKDNTTSVFNSRLVPEQVWDEQTQNTRWCGECMGSKLVSQSGWFPYHTWFKFCFGLFTRVNAFGLSEDLTRKILDYHKWRTPEQHQSGLRAIQHMAYGKRKEALEKQKWHLLKEGETALLRNREEGQTNITFSREMNYMS